MEKVSTREEALQLHSFTCGFMNYFALCSFNLHVATSDQLKMITTLGRTES